MGATNDGVRDVEARLRRLEDAHAIAQLRARYCQALDDGRWTDLAATFTADGAFVGLSTARGTEGLIEFFSALADGPISAWWHFSSNETVGLAAGNDGSDGDTATGETWLWQPCVRDGVAEIAAGRYRDTLVRDGGRWLFSERRVSFFFWSDLREGWRRGDFALPSAAAAADEIHQLLVREDGTSATGAETSSTEEDPK